MGYRLILVREIEDIEEAIKKVNPALTYAKDDMRENVMGEDPATDKYMIEMLPEQDITVFHYENEDIVVLLPVPEPLGRTKKAKEKKKWISEPDDIQNTRALYFYYYYKLQNEEFRHHFEEIAGTALKDLLPLTIPVAPLRTDNDYMPERSANIVFESFLIQNTRTGHTVTIDPGVLHNLCQAKLDLKYMQETLTPGAQRSVLLVIVYEQELLDRHTGAFGDKVMKGIRVTKLDTRVGKLYIEGKYACSKGYGQMIQEYTEQLLRNDLAYLANRRHGTQEQMGETSPHTLPKKSRKAPGVPEFTLYAIPQAAPFWEKKAHFRDLHSRRLHKMSKTIFPEDMADATKRTAVTNGSSRRT